MHHQTYNQEGAVSNALRKERQTNCMKFLRDQLFKTPEWMLDQDFFNKIE